MTKQLTATQVFLRALKETGEYDHVKKIIKYTNSCPRHVAYWWKPFNVNSSTFVEDLMRENKFDPLFVIDYISLGLEFQNEYDQFMKTTKKIHKWIMTNVNGNYLKRLLKYDIPEFEDGSRRGYHELKFTWRG